MLVGGNLSPGIVLVTNILIVAKMHKSRACLDCIGVRCETIIQGYPPVEHRNGIQNDEFITLGCTMVERYGEILKVVIAGKGGIGKTALCEAVTNKTLQLTTTYLLTVGVDFHTLQLDINGKRVTMQVSDLAGQRQFEAIVDIFVGGARGAILAYDITNLESYMALHDTWIPFVSSHVGNIPKIIVGTKADLSEHREVDAELISDFLANEAEKHNIIGSFETSSVSRETIAAPFQMLAEAIVASDHPN